MSLIKRKDKRAPLEVEIDKQIEALQDLEYLSDLAEYNARLDILEKLEKLRGEKPKKQRVSPDTILVVLAGLIQVGLILYREELGNVISSKAVGFVMRGRV